MEEAEEAAGKEPFQISGRFIKSNFVVCLMLTIHTGIPASYNGAIIYRPVSIPQHAQQGKVSEPCAVFSRWLLPMLMPSRRTKILPHSFWSSSNRVMFRCQLRQERRSPPCPLFCIDQKAANLPWRNNRFPQLQSTIDTAQHLVEEVLQLLRRYWLVKDTCHSACGTAAIEA